MILEEIKTIEFWNYFPPEFSANPDEHFIKAAGEEKQSIVLSKVNNKDADWKISNLSKFPEWLTASKKDKNILLINAKANSEEQDPPSPSSYKKSVFKADKKYLSKEQTSTPVVSLIDDKKASWDYINGDGGIWDLNSKEWMRKEYTIPYCIKIKEYGDNTLNIEIK
jgi:hypothetical protein